MAAEEAELNGEGALSVGPHRAARAMEAAQRLAARAAQRPRGGGGGSVGPGGVGSGGGAVYVHAMCGRQVRLEAVEHNAEDEAKVLGACAVPVVMRADNEPTGGLVRREGDVVFDGLR